MKKSYLVSSILLASSLATTSYADMGIYASLELDTDAVNTASGNTTYDQNGFVEIGATTRHEKGEYFVAAKGSVRLQSDGDENVTVRDVYIQLGTDVWDAQIGRFEAIDLFPKAKDTVIVHAGGVSVYEANKVRGFAGDDGGQIALHYNLSDNLKFELDTIFGDDDTAGDNGTAVSGYRPSITWSTDGLRLFAGMEKVNYDLTGGGDVDQTGFSIGANFDLAGANINLVATHLEDDNTNDEVSSYMANMVKGNFGAGIIFSEEDNATGVDPEVTTAYVAYSIPVFDIKNATVTFAGSYSEADGVADDNAAALRMRFNYTF